jgi:hypothetical protein
MRLSFQLTWLLVVGGLGYSLTYNPLKFPFHC